MGIPACTRLLVLNELTPASADASTQNMKLHQRSYREDSGSKSERVISPIQFFAGYAAYTAVLPSLRMSNTL